VGALDAGFGFLAVAMAPTPELAALTDEQVDAVRRAIAPWEAERTYFNFTEREADGRELYGELTYRRLREIKARYDADKLLFAAHQIRPA
jgi:hypothetical protein